MFSESNYPDLDPSNELFGLELRRYTLGTSCSPPLAPPNELKKILGCPLFTDLVKIQGMLFISLQSKVQYLENLILDKIFTKIS